MPRVNNERAVGYIRNREPFDNNNNTLSGGRRFRGWGDLPAEQTTRVASPVSYWVYSYDTPIAWVNGDGTVSLPAVWYDETTATHQSIAAKALGVTDPWKDREPNHQIEAEKALDTILKATGLTLEPWQREHAIMALARKEK